jgi:HK97 family phage major capsid protein
MASVTLAESAKLTQDMLLAGVIENVVEVNPLYEVLPFMGIEGNALSYNRENALGDVQFLGVGGTITAKAAATFTKVTSNLTTIIGDAEVNGLIQATRSNYTDQTAAQISSKAKSIGRKYQQNMIIGDGTGDTFVGLSALAAAGQTINVGTDGANLSFDILDQLIDAVKDKDGQVDYFMMPARTIRAFYALLRALGGASVNEVITLPSGRTVPQYRGIPIFRNDWIPTNQTKGTGTNTTTIFAGTFDDGSETHGISGLTAMDAAGLRVKQVGESETKDETITRVVMYCGLALFSELGLAIAPGILN